MFALEFPGIDEIVKWPAIFGDGKFFAFNKIALISVIAAVVPTILFLLAGSRGKKSLIPNNVSNIAESSIEFIDKQVARPAIGDEGIRYVPLLISIFFFVAIGNFFEVIPSSHMPANARMANPAVLAIVAWLMFIGVGIKHNGLGYLKSVLFPPGVPPALYLLVTPIEFFSTFISRPLSLAVRLFANMLAGHILLVTFSVLSISMFWATTSKFILIPMGLLPFAGLVAFTAFEFMVSFLQAYVFALLTAVYIGGALHPAH
jgi:F-type H+-transporting ATPase subunit a